MTDQALQRQVSPGRTQPRRDGRMRRDRLAYVGFLVPGAVLFVAVIGVPFVMNLGISLTRWQGVGTPTFVGLDNYRTLMSDSAFWSSFEHNVALIFAMAVIPTLIGLVLAALLYDVIDKHFGSRWVTVLRSGMYLPQVLPIAVAGIVWTWILAPDNGALNALLDAVGLGRFGEDWLGDPNFALVSVMVVLVWVQLGFPLVIFMSGLQRVDPTLLEAAELDGASWLRRFWSVTIPQIRPEIYVVLLWCTIAGLKVFPQIYVLTRGGPGGATNVPSYFSFQNFFEKTQVGYGASVATVLTVLVLVLTIGFLRVQAAGEDEES